MRLVVKLLALEVKHLFCTAQPLKRQDLAPTPSHLTFEKKSHASRLGLRLPDSGRPQG
jgi:hypothetical protein